MTAKMFPTFHGVCRSRTSPATALLNSSPALWMARRMSLSPNSLNKPAVQSCTRGYVQTKSLPALYRAGNLGACNCSFISIHAYPFIYRWDVAVTIVL